MGHLGNVARAFGVWAKVIGWDTLVRGERVNLQIPRGYRRLTGTSTASEARVLTFRPNTESERFSALCWWRWTLLAVLVTGTCQLQPRWTSG